MRQVRNSLTPTAFASAATLLPVSWLGSPPPYDICLRFGEYGLDPLLEDIATLAGWCRSFVYKGSLVDDVDAITTAWSAAHAAAHTTPSPAAHAVAPHSHRAAVGAFVVMSSGHIRPAGAPEFVFVNKTPPSAPELYSPHCMQDMAGCDWHKGVPP